MSNEEILTLITSANISGNLVKSELETTGRITANGPLYGYLLDLDKIHKELNKYYSNLVSGGK